MGMAKKPVRLLTALRSRFGRKPGPTVRNHRLKFWRTPVGLFMGLVLALSVTTAAYAISNLLPEPADDGSIPSLVIGRMAGGSTLPADETYLKLIYQARPDVVDVFDAAWCQDSQYDHQEDEAPANCRIPDPNGQVYFDFQALNNDTGAVGPVYRVLASTMAANGGVNGNYRVNLSTVSGMAPSTDGRWFVRVRVHWQLQNPDSCTPASPIDSTCRTGSNFFRVSIPRAGDLATYAVINGQSSPLTVENDGPSAPEASDMTFYFAPPCNATGGALVQPLRWRDADYNEGNQRGNISWDLIDDTAQGGPQLVASQSNGQLGGQGDDAQYPNNGGFTFQAGHKYRWIWRNVDKNNGVQLFFPYDSYNYVRECASVTLDKTSNAPPNLAATNTFDYMITVTRNGPPMGALSITDTLSQHLQYIPDPSNVPVPNNVNGQTLTWNFPSGSQYMNQLNTSGSFQIRFRVMVRETAPVGQIQNTVTGNGTDPGGNPVTVPPDTTTVTVVTPDLSQRPYFQVRGGDVSAGMGMDIGGQDCRIAGNTFAGISSWNRNTSPYGGAGTQYAGFAFGRLQGFATAQPGANGTGGFSAPAPSGLAFANTPAAQIDVAGGLYGGRFDTPGCVPDYFAGVTNAQSQNGFVTIGATNIPSCVPPVAVSACRQTRYVRGDVYISGNITFAGANAYPNVSAIPSFSLIVEGNIYIAPGVTQLDGYYIAQPPANDLTEGIIYTCATDSTAPFGAAPLNRTLHTSCNTPLTVNGAFSARQVWLLRTAGNVTTTAAETFNFTPELWMGASQGTGGVTGDTADYDAIISLPPVL